MGRRPRADASITRLRLLGQRLIGPTLTRPDDAVRWFGAVQSQDYPAAKWAIAQRTTRATSADVDRLFDEGKILRTHVMRPTWHFVAPEDLRWLRVLNARRLVAADAHNRRDLELDGNVLARGYAILARGLEGGRNLTRAESSALLRAGGIEATGRRLGHLLYTAEVEGVIVSGPLRGKQHTHALFDERVPGMAPLARGEALGELAHRYFTSHGPATVSDFAWWSGLTVKDVHEAIEAASGRLERTTFEGTPYWLGAKKLRRGGPRPAVHLLPNFDEYVVAYKDRRATFDAGVHRSKDPGLVLLSNVVLEKGLVVGGWRRAVTKKGMGLETKLLVRFAKPARTALFAAARRFGRFLGTEVSVRP